MQQEIYFKYFFALTLIYLTITLTEWFFHKHLMHNPQVDPGHIRHHKSVKRDMTLEEEDYHEMDIHMGVHHSCIIFLWSIVCVYFITYHVCELKINIQIIITFSLCLSIFYHEVWNIYHRKMHFEKAFFQETRNPYLKWMYENHAKHHLQKGKRKGNYNILFPGGDHLMGDYRTYVDNTEYCNQDGKNKDPICKFEKFNLDVY